MFPSPVLARRLVVQVRGQGQVDGIPREMHCPLIWPKAAAREHLHLLVLELRVET